MNSINLIDVLESSAGSNDKGIYFIRSEKEQNFISYKALFEKARNVLYQLQKNGIDINSEVILQLDDSENFLVVFWACILGGLVPVPLTVGSNDEHRNKLLNIWSVLKQPYLITDASVFDSLGIHTKNSGREDIYENIRKTTIYIDDINQCSELGTVVARKEDDIAFIQFSSGSTGEPKGVVLTHNNLISNINAIIECSGIHSNDSCFSWMPLTHDMGMIGFHLVPLRANINHAIMPTTLFVRHPMLWFKKVNELRSTLLSSPNFGYKYFLSHLKADKATDWDLSCVRLIFNGAEPISIDLIKEFLDTLKTYHLTENSMYTVYGMAEASLAVAFPRFGEPYSYVNIKRDSLITGQRVVEAEVDDYEHDVVRFADEGYSVKGCELRVVDDSNQQVNENIIGHIQIKGLNVTAGYYNNQEATEKVKTIDGWLRTGDLGFIKEGRLIVTGREKDIIFVNGLNYYPHDLEKMADGIAGCEINKLVLCGTSSNKTLNEEIIAFIMFKKKTDEFIPIVKEIKNLYKQKIGIEIKDVIAIKNIPKTTSGKVQRYKLIEKYIHEEFRVQIQEINLALQSDLENRRLEKPTNPIEENLLEICKKIFQVSEVSISDNFLEWGGGSLLLTQVHSEIEEIYPGKVKISDLFAYPSIVKLAEYITSYGPIQLERITMPEQLFSNLKMEGIEESGFQFQLQDKMVERLHETSISEKTDVSNLLFSLYLFVLSEISNNSSVIAYTSTVSNRRIIPVTVDFSEVKDVSSLVKKVEGMIGINASHTVQALEKVKYNRDFTSIATMFFTGNQIDMNTTLLTAFDLVLKTNMENGTIGITCHFNSRKLSKDGVKLLIKNYVKCISLSLA